MFGVPKNPDGSDSFPPETRYTIQEFYGENWNPLKLALEQDGIADHLAYWAKQMQDGIVLIAGPWKNFEAAWIVLSDQVTTWNQAQQIAAGDPWSASGQVETVIQAWYTNPLST